MSAILKFLFPYPWKDDVLKSRQVLAQAGLFTDEDLSSRPLFILVSRAMTILRFTRGLVSAGNLSTLVNELTLREAVSAVQHSIWAAWMAYVFKVCPSNDDGSVTIPGDLVKRWTRQIHTPYAQLSEQEKDSDREQADKVLNVFKEPK